MQLVKFLVFTILISGLAASLPASAQQLTNQQKNAVGEAKSYLSFSAFSRNGLIDQLSSRAGSGYDVEDATIAVDSLDIDYNEQAFEAAEQYNKIFDFSCNRMVDQLSSKAGNKFTQEQAEYGAKKAGLC